MANFICHGQIQGCYFPWLVLLTLQMILTPVQSPVATSEHSSPFLYMAVFGCSRFLQPKQDQHLVLTWHMHPSKYPRIGSFTSSNNLEHSNPKHSIPCRRRKTSNWGGKAWEWSITMESTHCLPQLTSQSALYTLNSGGVDRGDLKEHSTKAEFFM